MLVTLNSQKSPLLSENCKIKIGQTPIQCHCVPAICGSILNVAVDREWHQIEVSSISMVVVNRGRVVVRISIYRLLWACAKREW
jgi:hypothetical protein